MFSLKLFDIKSLVDLLGDDFSPKALKFDIGIELDLLE
jgi:hypothetical protein